MSAGIFFTGHAVQWKLHNEPQIQPSLPSILICMLDIRAWPRASQMRSLLCASSPAVMALRERTNLVEGVDRQTNYTMRMPRYFFHAADGAPVHDTHGFEMADDAEARAEALRYAGELLKLSPQLLTERNQLRVSVTNETGVLCSTVVTVVVDVPKLQRSLKQQPAND